MRVLRALAGLIFIGVLAGFLIGFYAWALLTMQGANW